MSVSFCWNISSLFCVLLVSFLDFACQTSIEYVSLLQINKIVKYFYLQDEFSIDSPDPDGMDSYLAGFRNEPYSKKQFDVDEMICNYLKEKGYSRLYINDMDEVYPGIKKFKGREETNQMTVGNALFMDMWELCNSD